MKCWPRIALASCIVCWCADHGVAATQHAVVFAPSTYRELPDAPYHADGADRVIRQLVKNGLPEEQIHLLQGEAASAEGLRKQIVDLTFSLEPDDSFLVVLLSHGVSIAGKDYLCAVDSTPIELTSGQPVRSLISVADVVAEMSVAQSASKLLVIDGTSDLDASIPAGVTLAFGRNMALDNQQSQLATIISRGSSTASRTGDATLTTFLWSFLDGLDTHADRNGDSQLTTLELTGYMTAHARENNRAVPVVAGRISDVTPILSVPEKGAAQGADALTLQARSLFEEGRKALFYELDGRAGLRLLDRAARLCRDRDLMRQIDDHRRIGDVLLSGATKAFQARPIGNHPVTIVLPNDIELFAAGTSTPAGRLPAGTVIRCQASNPQWLFVHQAARPRLTADEMFFDAIPEVKGFVRMSSLNVVPSAATRSQHLRRQFAAHALALPPSPLATSQFATSNQQ